jgi:hypothetical protein
MKSLGFNFARVDGLDWRYMDQNPSALLPLLQQVAQYADSNGIYCNYLFGGGYEKFPLGLVSGMTGQQFYTAFWSNSLTYNGTSVWEALFQGLFKPTIQALDSHPSTIGYGIMNEPWTKSQAPTDAQLHNYDEYITQRIRTLSSKAVVFQSTSIAAASIVADAPTPDLKPYVYEGHNYQVGFDPYSNWISGAQQAQAVGVYHGEWHVYPGSSTTQADITHFVTEAKNFKMSTTWFIWTCHSNSPELLDNNCQPTSECLLLSQLYTQILGYLT